MARLIERLDTELPSRGFRRVQASELRTERWERKAAPVCAVSVRRTKKRWHVSIEAGGVGRLQLAPAGAGDPEAVLVAVDALVGAAWGGGRAEPAVVVSSIDEAPIPAGAGPTVPVPVEAWTRLLDGLEKNAQDAAAASERAAVAETRLASLEAELRRAEARADEAGALAAAHDKAVARVGELESDRDRLRVYVDLLSEQLRRRRDPGFFDGLVALLRRRPRPDV